MYVCTKKETWYDTDTATWGCPPHQQIGQQDGHDNEEDDPEDVGHLWERGQQVPAFHVVAKDAVILKLPNGHHHGFDEGETGIPKGGNILLQTSHSRLQCEEEVEDTERRDEHGDMARSLLNSTAMDVHDFVIMTLQMR